MVFSKKTVDRGREYHQTFNKRSNVVKVFSATWRISDPKLPNASLLFFVCCSTCIVQIQSLTYFVRVQMRPEVKSGGILRKTVDQGR